MQHPPAILELHGLLAERNRHSDPYQRSLVDERIQARFERDLAVLVSDMSGFSRVTQEEGIIHFLALIQRMQGLCVPLIEAHGGKLVKSEADNLFAVFPSAPQAVQAAIAMRAACQFASQGKPRNERIGVAIGVGFGPILDVDGQDFFGDQVNQASKLGEDLADTGDILLTQAAALQVDIPLDEREVRISNIQLGYFAVTEGT